jgi:hypothetical protein
MGALREAGFRCAASMYVKVVVIIDTVRERKEKRT